MRGEELPGRSRLYRDHCQANPYASDSLNPIVMTLQLIAPAQRPVQSFLNEKIDPTAQVIGATVIPIPTARRRYMLILNIFLILLLAAALEVGGDALVRMGLEGTPYYLIVGGLTLFVYGIVVNKSRLDFNRLMGVYIAVFFVVSQIISFVLFKQIPDGKIIIGGGFIVVGGLIISIMA